MKLYHGDCLEEMSKIPDGSVDLVLTDPPYGTTACKWDSVIPLRPMWEQLRRVIKENGAIVMTASQPFTSVLICSNLKMFKYCWVWEKNKGSNFQSVKYQPFKEHEDVAVFYNKMPTYNAQRIARSQAGKSRLKYNLPSERGINPITGLKTKTNKQDAETRSPKSIIRFNCEMGRHPTQKPVALMEYLIKTYTNEGDTVLDFTMGSGTTGVACNNLNRNFIGIEKDEEYFNLAKRRIEESQPQYAMAL